MHNGKEVRYRIVELNNGKYCFQTAVQDDPGDQDSGSDDPGGDEAPEKTARGSNLADEQPEDDKLRKAAKKGKSAKKSAVTAAQEEAAEEEPAGRGARTRKPARK